MYTERGTQAMYVDGIPLRIFSSQNADMDTERAEPYFVLQFGLMELPWSLNEPACDVLSPANEPAYIQRMNEKLLKLLQETEVS